MKEKLRQIAKSHVKEAVDLTSQLIRVPSFSGEERNIAEFTAKTMKQMKFDEVWTDKAGNVIGRMQGRGGGKSVILNCHLDTVSEGDPKIWTYPPFSGEVAQNHVWGRGASDTKGAFAAQICAAHGLLKAGLIPKGDVFVVGVVHEEDSGLGSQVLVQDLKADYAIIGEATANNIAIGNRGRMRFDIHIKGKSCHASKPELGVNPHFFLSSFVRRLNEFPMESDQTFGRPTLAPTLIRCSEKGTNIIPSELILSIDYRIIPSETYESIIHKFQVLGRQCAFDGIEFWVDQVTNPITCYTGLKQDAYEGAPAFVIDRDHPLVAESKRALENVFDRSVPTEIWNFATDAGHFMRAGIPTIGFAPAEFKYCHTTEERISIAMLEEGLLGNMALIWRLCNSDF
jgi:putative selenium metabolism hydrolase